MRLRPAASALFILTAALLVLEARAADVVGITGGKSSQPDVVRYGSPEYARLVAYGPMPRYPRKAWDMQYTGTALYRLRLRQTGEVSEIKVIKSAGHHILDSAALVTLVTWKFKRPAPEFVLVPLKFEL